MENMVIFVSKTCLHQSYSYINTNSYSLTDELAQKKCSISGIRDHYSINISLNKKPAGLIDQWRSTGDEASKISLHIDRFLSGPVHLIMCLY